MQNQNTAQPAQVLQDMISTSSSTAAGVCALTALLLQASRPRLAQALQQLPLPGRGITAAASRHPECAPKPSTRCSSSSSMATTLQHPSTGSLHQLLMSTRTSSLMGTAGTDARCKTQSLGGHRQLVRWQLLKNCMFVLSDY